MSLKKAIARTFTPKEYAASTSNRSEADNGRYIAAVQAAVRSYKAFSTFKRHPDYRVVLEHVTKEQGALYLDLLKKGAPDFLQDIEKFKVNDLIGNPLTFSYPGVGEISPTTLRYMTVAANLRKLFGRNIGENIAEIGAGYGGQLLVSDLVFSMRRYTLFDLAPVLALVEKYLESHLLNCAYQTTTLNRHSGDDVYDLVISNYAFSELPAELQRRYIGKLMRSAKRGYLTMNSGLPDSVFQRNKLTLAELTELLPEFKVLPEEPAYPGNYVIVWGQTER
jgi:putative sugar O-methyltransferase